MSQSTSITIVGNVVNTPLRKDVGENQLVEFRVAVNDSRLDPATKEWVEKTSFFKVCAWRALGANVGESLRKGDRVIVQGNLRIREYRTEKDEPRLSVEISAHSIGMDLTYGVARFQKVRRNGDGSVVVPDDASALRSDPLAVDAPAAEQVTDPGNQWGSWGTALDDAPEPEGEYETV